MFGKLGLMPRAPARLNAARTMAVLNPLKVTDHSIMQDTDLAGPLVFCLAFGGSLLLVSTFIHVQFARSALPVGHRQFKLM
ncbi:hypothetical protein BaRGS_00005036 [Batillaria attramentaria]|uniref:Uncharacterized protein n=1 Tax=Batillaria attramentaria TaxID=370345 RepID=A0ABD0LXR6_9CAEN